MGLFINIPAINFISFGQRLYDHPLFRFSLVLYSNTLSFFSFSVVILWTIWLTLCLISLLGILFFSWSFFIVCLVILSLLIFLVSLHFSVPYITTVTTHSSNTSHYFGIYHLAYQSDFAEFKIFIMQKLFCKFFLYQLISTKDKM